LASERVTARELIKRRVRQEVQDYNTSTPETFRGLIKPSQAEEALNGFRLKKRTAVNADEQLKVAVEAFSRNGFLLLVDDQQLTSLDEVIGLTESSRVTFVKLVPLVGG
jgi:hypothetical protein